MPNPASSYQTIVGVQPTPNLALSGNQQSNMGNQMQGMMVQYPPMQSYQVFWWCHRVWKWESIQFILLWMKFSLLMIFCSQRKLLVALYSSLEAKYKTMAQWIFKCLIEECKTGVLTRRSLWQCSHRKSTFHDAKSSYTVIHSKWKPQKDTLGFYYLLSS